MDAILTARASLARLDNSTANGETALNFASLSKAASASNLSVASGKQEEAASPVASTPDAGVYHYLLSSVEKAKQQGDTATAKALEQKLQADFPQGEPTPPQPLAPIAPPLSAPNELNILAEKSAQALRDLKASRAALEVAKDRVLACQNQLNEAKELATKASAEVSLAAARYQEAGIAVKNFNEKVQSRELAAASAITEIVEQSLKQPKAEKNEKKAADVKLEPTYASVVANGGKGQDTDSGSPASPVLPAQPKRKEDGQPDLDGDDGMLSQHSGGSQQTTASKRLKKQKDAMYLEAVNDYMRSGQMILEPKLRQDQQYLAELTLICEKHRVQLTDMFAAADKTIPENLIQQMVERQKDEEG